MSIRPVLAIIGGTGLLSWGESRQQLEPDTPYGEISAPIEVFGYNQQNICFLARHGSRHALAPHQVNYRANLWALGHLGVERVLAVNAVGGIDKACAPGRLVIPDQLIDYTWGRAHSFNQDAEGEVLHVDFTRPYDGPLRRSLLQAAQDSGLAVVAQATMGVTQGPRLETAAEIRKLEQDGCHIVGMTSMPEAALARELGMDYACLAVVANPAAGLSEQEITMAAVHALLEQGMSSVRAVILRLLGAEGM